MKKRKSSWLIFGSLMFSLCLTGVSCTKNFAMDQAAYHIMKAYINNPDDVNPYIVSILALNEVEHERRLQKVKHFISWYFSKLNYPDRHGLYGTIYDYIVKNGRKESTEKYDSVDGYAGLFLHLLHRYVVKTGDTELIEANWDKIEDIAYLIPYLQDKDGLTQVLLGNHVKYLMDNCEAYGGISSYIALRNLLGKSEEPYYNVVRDSIKNGILKNLYDSKNEIFAWAIENNYRSESSWECFYPDALAQIFPIYYDVLIDKPEIKDKLWRKFEESYGSKSKEFPVEQRIIYELTKAKMEKCENNLF